MQRLRAGLHVYGGGSGVFPGARLFVAETLQTVPPGQEKRTTGWRRRVQPRFIAGHKRDLRRMRTADHSSIRAPRGPSRVLPELLSGAEDQRRRWRQSARRGRRRFWQRPLGHCASGSVKKAHPFDFRDVAALGFLEAAFACFGTLTTPSRDSGAERESPVRHRSTDQYLQRFSSPRSPL